ncbi:hypothetical protein KAZ01_01790 [Candidatus Gracilibacteria bacterium]|nr:hypothetical protein [Candidatus Gracilibacteria bacterium]
MNETLKEFLIGIITILFATGIIELIKRFYSIKIPYWSFILLILIAYIIGFYTRDFIKSKKNIYLPVIEIKIIKYDPESKIIYGDAVLLNDEKILILIFAGKTGGPYWLQGANGKFYSETERNRTDVNWQISWLIREVYLGKKVNEIRAIAINPKYLNKIIEKGEKGPMLGNA